METLKNILSNKILLNSILSIFWIVLLSEKYEKLLAGDTKSIMLSLLYVLMLSITSYSLFRALKNSKKTE
jgi:hypothetical protein